MRLLYWLNSLIFLSSLTMHNFAFMQTFLMTFYVYQDLSIIKLCFHMPYDTLEDATKISCLIFTIQTAAEKLSEIVEELRHDQHIDRLHADNEPIISAE